MREENNFVQINLPQSWGEIYEDIFPIHLWLKLSMSSPFSPNSRSSLTNFEPVLEDSSHITELQKLYFILQRLRRGFSLHIVCRQQLFQSFKPHCSLTFFLDLWLVYIWIWNCCLIIDISFLLQYVPSSAHDSPYWTTNSGAPVWNNNQSLTAGVRGPVLLEDYHLVEKLAQFDRERIPERVVHARGASAKGFFEVSLSACLLQQVLIYVVHFWYSIGLRQLKPHWAWSHQYYMNALLSISYKTFFAGHTRHLSFVMCRCIQSSRGPDTCHCQVLNSDSWERISRDAARSKGICCQILHQVSYIPKSRPIR